MPGAPAGSAASTVATAGSADSSPITTWKSAAGSGTYRPPGSETPTHAPGRASRAHAAAGPCPSCSTKSTSISLAPASNRRTV